MRILTQIQAEEIVERQKKYFDSGCTRDLSFRLEQLRRLHAGIVKYENKLLDALNSDLGKCAFEGYATEIGFVLSSISCAIK